MNEEQGLIRQVVPAKGQQKSSDTFKNRKTVSEPNHKWIIQHKVNAVKFIAEIANSYNGVIKMDMLILLLCFVWVMIAAMEIADFVTVKIEEVKGAAQRKATFQSFYAADKSLKYLK